MAGMKALILDAVTTRVVSMVYSQTQILEKEVYLVEQLGKRHEPMTHLKAAMFIQPTETNYDLLLKELKDPKFKEYHIFFSNIGNRFLLLLHHIITIVNNNNNNSSERLDPQTREDRRT